MKDIKNLLYNYTKERCGYMSKKNKQENNVNNKEKENEKNEGKYKMYESIVVLVISGISLGVSIFVACFTVYYANKEYEYKLSPEITAKTEVRVKAYKVGDDTEHKVYSDKIEIKILNKNNMDKAYLIYPNNVVKKLTINEMENTLEEDLNEDAKMEKYDLEVGNKFYQYRFLFLTGKDGSNELYLIYMKTDGKEIVLDGVSGIEIWGLANANKDNPEYEGERIMAEQYEEILKESYDYIR